MPTYEYKCPKCKTSKDLFHPVIDTPVVWCHDCDVEMTKGIGGGVGVHFKGSGFYETDYKK